MNDFIPSTTAGFLVILLGLIGAVGLHYINGWPWWVVAAFGLVTFFAVLGIMYWAWAKGWWSTGMEELEDWNDK